MKSTHPLIFGLCVAVCAGGAVLAANAPTAVTVATFSPANLVINKAMHFPAADGGSAALDVGNYLVMAEPKGGLQLISAGGKKFIIAAAAATHDEKLAAPRAVIVAVGDDERHLVLLQPDGKRLEAIGSASGIGSRGLARPAMASNIALQTAVLQAPPVQVMAPAPPAAPAPAPVPILKGPILQTPRMPATGPAPYTGLLGWADLHVHLMVNIAFGGKLIHGAPDEQSLMPSDIFCNHWHRAGSVAIALSDDRPTHGGWDIGFQCGDAIRPLVINALETGNEGALVIDGPGYPPAGGFPDFIQWPKWNDIAHQKMWWEWLRRGRDYGQRVMVALATNNRTLGDAASGPGDGPTDDKASADLQLTEIKLFVARHPDFMEVAYGAADIQRIVLSNRIAVVLGLEIDNIGDFNMIINPPRDQILPTIIPAEVQRLYDEGVRYVLPIHVSDSLLGGTAIYQDAFNTANYRETGHFWMIECADVSDNITHTYIPKTDATVAAAGFVKLGLNPFIQPPPSPVCPGGQPNKSSGHRNMLGLTNAGAQLIKELMKRGMIVDIDHMSQKSADQTLAIAESFGYPIMSGHAGIRGWQGANAENSRTPVQLQRISRLHGMFGLGTDGVYSYAWAQAYQQAILKMGYLNPAIANYQNGAVAFGTDLNGLVKGPMPGGSANRVKYDTTTFPPSGTSGSVKTWDYNTEGVAHYGMLADFIRDVRTAPSNGYIGANGQQMGVAGPDLVDNHLMRSADYFWHTWQQAEAMKGNVH